MKPNSMKSLSLSEIEVAFSKALSDLAGYECKVTLDELRFGMDRANEFMGLEVAAISGRMVKERNYSEGVDENGNF